MNSLPLLLLTGPTASGKSTLAVAAARRLNGEILSVDSVQVYAHCDVGSAKIPHAERGGIPHHLLDLYAPDQPCNAALFLAGAEAALAEIRRAGKQPVLCGGTTLYLKAMLYGLAAMPPASPGLRADLEELSDEALHARLQQVDPASAERLHPHDRVRLIRALEAQQLSGAPASMLRAQHGYRHIRNPALAVVLCWPRDVLYSRIERRSAEMIGSGLLEEARELCERYGSGIPALQTVGYVEALDFLQGRLPQESLCEEIAKHTRRLAKMQMTFWRNEPHKRGWNVRPRPEEPAAEIGAEQTSKGRAFRVLQHGFEELCQALQRRLASGIDGVEVWYVDARRVLPATAE